MNTPNPVPMKTLLLRIGLRLLLIIAVLLCLTLLVPPCWICFFLLFWPFWPQHFWPRWFKKSPAVWAAGTSGPCFLWC